MNAECKERLAAVLKWHHAVKCTHSMIAGCGEAEQHGAESNTKIHSSWVFVQQAHRRRIASKCIVSSVECQVGVRRLNTAKMNSRGKKNCTLEGQQYPKAGNFFFPVEQIFHRS